jgi:hypothetical protein
MKTLPTIQEQIEKLSQERTLVTRALSEGHDPKLVAERERINGELATLWDAARQARVRIAHGERDKIIARARQEERLERAA